MTVQDIVGALVLIPIIAMVWALSIAVVLWLLRGAK